MPIYCYRCPMCSAIEEIKQGVNDREYPICPKCSTEEEQVKMYPRILGGPIHFKGSGFYETDYKGK